ncbi:MAG: tandem-95 repeat protein, partial [Myxococcales bacterium]|nr:tandem-95 repeat protein [Myxococcales bacterium]
MSKNFSEWFEFSFFYDVFGGQQDMWSKSKLKQMPLFAVLILGELMFSEVAQAQPNILVLDDSSNGNTNYLTHACNNIGANCTISSVNDFVSILGDGVGWDAIVFDYPSSSISGAGWREILVSYIQSGGRVIYNGWKDGEITPALADALGLTNLQPTYDPPRTLYSWGHILWNYVEQVSDTLVPISDSYGVHGVPATPTNGAEGAAGFILSSADPAQSSIIIGNDGRTIYNIFIYDNYDGAEMIKLLMNELYYILGPHAFSQAVTTPEDQALNITLVGDDPEDLPLTYIIVDPPSHGTVILNGSVATYTPAQDYNGPDSFTFKVYNGEDYSNIATIDITVTPVNDAPVAQDDSVTTPEETPLTIQLMAMDVDGDSLTYSIVDHPSHGTVILNGSVATYTPAQDYNGSDTFTFKANDGAVDSNVATVSIVVTGINDVPVAQSDLVTTPEDSPLPIELMAMDADGDSLTYSIVDHPSHGTVILIGSVATYTPAQDYNGSDSFTFKVNDGTDDSNVATIDIMVTPVNDTPVAQADSLTTPEETPLPIQLMATDVEGNALIYSIVDHPSHGTVILNGSAATYAPAQDYNGPDSFTFKVNDETDDSNVATIDIMVTPINDAPIIILATREYTIEAGKTITFDFTATDADGDALLGSLLPQENGAVQNQVGDQWSYSWTPAVDLVSPEEGELPFQISITVSDGHGGTDTILLTITVTTSDLDGDSVLNDDDNCPLVSNTDQTDTDSDDIGDACEDDDDDDGFADGDDNCPLIQNPDQTDTDDDDIGDACDNDDDDDAI